MNGPSLTGAFPSTAVDHTLLAVGVEPPLWVYRVFIRLSACAHIPRVLCSDPYPRRPQHNVGKAVSSSGAEVDPRSVDIQPGRGPAPGEETEGCGSDVCETNGYGEGKEGATERHAS